jgi:hypothetical protein
MNKSHLARNVTLSLFNGGVRKNTPSSQKESEISHSSIKKWEKS